MIGDLIRVAIFWVMGCIIAVSVILLFDIKNLIFANLIALVCAAGGLLVGELWVFRLWIFKKSGKYKG